MLDKILSYVNQHRMIQEQDKLIAGVSGGADSVCLVLVLLEIRKKIPFTMEIAHLHHGIRGEEADRDAAFVEDFCRKHQLKFHLEKADIPALAEEYGLSEEEMGRKARYAFFEKLRKTCGADKIAVAHNKNDCAETVLFNLIRGTGIRGLCGIPPVNEKIIRPLLCVERTEIEDYLQKRGVSFCTDSTNLGDAYTRNKIRNRVLPYIARELNPGVTDAMYRAAENLRQISEYMEDCADEVEESYLSEIGNRVRLSGKALYDLPKALVSELLLRGFVRVAHRKRDFSEKHREMLYALMTGETGKTVSLPGGVLAKNVYGDIFFQKAEADAVQEDFSMEIPLENGRYYLNENNYLEISVEKYEKDEIISEKKYTKWFDYDIIKGTLQIRTRKTGDWISVTKEGGKKKLKDYFINEKIPREERESTLLLADEQEVLWILGYRISEAYKIGPDTKQVLKVRYGGNIYGTED